jgi:hypothetical protein
LREVAVLLEPLTVAEKAAEQARVLVQRLPGDLKNDPSQLNAVVLGAGPIGLLGAMKLVDGKFNTWVYSLDKADSPNVGIEIDAEGIMRNLVLKNHVLCGTVNAGRASFEEGVRDLGSFMQRFPAAVRALITARVNLGDARDTVLSRGGIKSVIEVA